MKNIAIYVVSDTHLVIKRLNHDITYIGIIDDNQESAPEAEKFKWAEFEWSVSNQKKGPTNAVSINDVDLTFTLQGSNNTTTRYRVRIPNNEMFLEFTNNFGLYDNNESHSVDLKKGA